METTSLANIFQLGAQGPASLPGAVLQPDGPSPRETFEALLLSARDGEEILPDEMPLEILELLLVGSLTPPLPNAEQNPIPEPAGSPVSNDPPQGPLLPHLEGLQVAGEVQNEGLKTEPLPGQNTEILPVNVGDHPGNLSNHPIDSLGDQARPADHQSNPVAPSSSPVSFSETQVPLPKGLPWNFLNEMDHESLSDNPTAPESVSKESSLDSSKQAAQKKTPDTASPREVIFPAAAKPSGFLNEMVGIEKRGDPAQSSPERGTERHGQAEGVLGSQENSPTVADEMADLLSQGRTSDAFQEGKGIAFQQRYGVLSASEGREGFQPEEDGLPVLSKKGPEMRLDSLQGTGNSDHSSSGPAEGETGKIPPMFSAREASPDICRQVGRQVLWSLKNNEEKVRLSLEPPELGQIYVEIQREKGHIRATLWTDNALTKETLETHQTQLHRQLKEDGFILEKFDVFIKQETGWFQGRKESPTGQSFGRQDPQEGETSFAASDASGTAPVFSDRFITRDRTVDFFV